MTLAGLVRRVYGERRALVLPLLVLLVLNLAALLLGVLPLRRAVTTAREDASSAVIDRAAAVRQQASARSLVDRRQQVDIELATFYGDVLPANLNEARRLFQVWLYEIATDRDLQFTSSDSEFAELRDSRLVRVQSEVRLRGRYVDIRRFIRDVETGDDFVIVEGVQLGETGLQTGDANLELLLNVATYFVPRPAGDS